MARSSRSQLVDRKYIDYWRQQTRWQQGRAVAQATAKLLNQYLK